MRLPLALALFATVSVRLIAHNQHVILVAQSAKTELKYHGGYTATWTAEVIEIVDQQKGDRKSNNEQKRNVIKYTLELERPASDKGDKAISLYNLRLQGGKWGVTITSADPAITFYDSLADATATKPSPIAHNPQIGGWPIKPAGVGANSGAQQDKVAVMKWDKSGGNKCTIVVFSDRKINGPLSKFTQDSQVERERQGREGHHSEPPPGTPGGEEGDPR